MASVRRSEAKRRDAVRAWVNERKLELGCRVCGFREHHAALDFAHRDRKSKSGNISLAVRNWPMAKVKAEVEKCDVVCANHHRIETFLENESLYLEPKTRRNRRFDAERVVAEEAKRKYQFGRMG